MYIHCEGIDVCGYESMCIAFKLWLEIHTPGWASPVSTEMVQPMNDLEVTEMQKHTSRQGGGPRTPAPWGAYVLGQKPESMKYVSGRVQLKHQLVGKCASLFDNDAERKAATNLAPGMLVW